MGSMHSAYDKIDVDECNDRSGVAQLICSVCYTSIKDRDDALTCYNGHWYCHRCKTEKNGRCYKLFVTQHTYKPITHIWTYIYSR